jgi:hypothetical protein
MRMRWTVPKLSQNYFTRILEMLWPIVKPKTIKNTFQVCISFSHGMNNTMSLASIQKHILGRRDLALSSPTTRHVETSSRRLYLYSSTATSQIQLCENRPNTIQAFQYETRPA